MLKFLVFIFCVSATSAVAQNSRSFVSNLGSDSASCNSQTAACRTFNRALAVTNAGGEVYCVDEVVDVGISIQSPVTIDCSRGRAHLTGGPQYGIFIRLLQNDIPQIARLKGISINFQNAPGVQPSQTIGIQIQGAASVYIDDMDISAATLHGIVDNRASPGHLFVSNSRISNNGSVGVLAITGQTNGVVLDKVTLEKNGYGVAATSGNLIAISRSTITANRSAGVEADQGAQVELTNSLVSHNAVGVQAFGTIRLRENDVKFSNVALQGSPISMGANRFSGNSSLGAVPTSASNAPQDIYN